MNTRLMTATVASAIAAALTFTFSPTDAVAQGEDTDADQIGNFYYIEDSDAMTDAPIDFIMTANDYEKHGLGFKCMSSGDLNLVILPGSASDRMALITGENAALARFRVDDDDPTGPHELRMPETIPRAGDDLSREIAQDVATGDQLAVRLFNTKGERIWTNTYDMTKVKEALNRLPCFP